MNWSRRRWPARGHRVTTTPPIIAGCGGRWTRPRGLDTDSRPLETAFRLRHALRLLADPGDPAVVGTIDEHLAEL